MVTLADSPSQSLRSPSALVRGAGPSGALAALALADAGWRVALVDPSSAAQLLERPRAYAFTHSSRRFLQRLGLWGAVVETLEPFTRLELEDVGAGRSTQFAPVDLGQGSQEGPQPVGWIGEHRPLMELLLARISAHPAIECRLGTGQQGTDEHDEHGGPRGDGDIGVDWTIAADGASSPTRHALAIGAWRHRYHQCCLTTQVRLRGARIQTAWERLRPEGPFALLPMGQGRFQVVWSAPAWRCRHLADLPAAAFLDALAPILPPDLDVEALEHPPQVFPVGLLLAHRLRRGRTILLGESAHHCHPVGGQGLNLCWRDVAALHQLALRVREGRLPLERLGVAYARRRWADVGLTLLITDALVRLFSNRHPLLLPLRRWVVGQLRQHAFLRRQLLVVMSQGPCQAFRLTPT